MVKSFDVNVEVRGSERLQDAIAGLQEPLARLAEAMEAVEYRSGSWHMGEWRSLGLTLRISMDFAVKGHDER